MLHLHDRLEDDRPQLVGLLVDGGLEGLARGHLEGGLARVHVVVGPEEQGALARRPSRSRRPGPPAGSRGSPSPRRG